MELLDTIELMGSEDYKERFKAEYYQLDIRIKKLADVVMKYEQGQLEFKPDCSLELLQEQLYNMRRYRDCLEIRSNIENIEL